MGMQVTSTREEASVTGKLARLDRISRLLSIWLNWIAGAGLVAMLVLVVADIIGIKALSHPIPGGIEMTAFLGVVIIGFSMAYTQVVKGHILVDFVVTKFPKRVQGVLEALVTLLSLGTFAILAWRSYDYARVLQITGEVSMTQKIPFYPFIYALGLCSLVLSLDILVDFIKAVQKVVRK